MIQTKPVSYIQIETVQQSSRLYPVSISKQDLHRISGALGVAVAQAEYDSQTDTKDTGKEHKALLKLMNKIDNLIREIKL